MGERRTGQNLMAMTLTEQELSRVRRLLLEIDTEVSGRARKSVVNTRTRNIRLLLNKAWRRANDRNTNTNT